MKNKKYIFIVFFILCIFGIYHYSNRHIVIEGISFTKQELSEYKKTNTLDEIIDTIKIIKKDGSISDKNQIKGALPVHLAILNLKKIQQKTHEIMIEDKNKYYKYCTNRVAYITNINHNDKLKLCDCWAEYIANHLKIADGMPYFLKEEDYQDDAKVELAHQKLRDEALNKCIKSVK